MPGAQRTRTPDIQGRRRVLQMAALAGAAQALGAILAPHRAMAAAKLAQNDIGYQNAPKGGLRCDACRNWQPPGSCKVVAGAISPTGWCGLFARRS